MTKGDSIPVGSDFDVLVRGVAADSAPAIYLSDATVTFALYTSESNALSEASAISGTAGTATYIASSNGDYRGTIADNQTASLTINTDYWLGVKIVTQDGKTDRRAISYTARGRGSK